MSHFRMTVTHLWFDNLIRVADNSDNQVASAAYKLSPGTNPINSKYYRFTEKCLFCTVPNLIKLLGTHLGA